MGRYLILFKKLICFALLMLPLTTWAQMTYSWEDFVEEWQEQMPDLEQQTAEEPTTLYDQLLSLHTQPVEVNRLQLDDLQQLPFLTDPQARTLLLYIRNHRPIHSLGELLLARGMDMLTLQKLRLFVFCRDEYGTPPSPTPSSDLSQRKSLDSLPSYPRYATAPPPANLIVATAKVPLYLRDGFAKYSSDQLAASPNKQYLGNPWAATFRYRADRDNRLQWGCTLQTDEGEPLAKSGNKWVDYSSFYLFGTGNGLLHHWALGDYRIQFGYGLTIGYGLFNNASAPLTFSSNRKPTITKYTSAAETGFLRGGAMALRWQQWEATLFASYQALDATLSNGQVTALRSTGYHRTPSELDHKDNLRQTTTGINLEYQYKNGEIGVSALYLYYSKPFTTGNALYRRYYQTGSDCYNVGLHHSLAVGMYTWTGELALSAQGGWASLQTISRAPFFGVKTFLQHRYYDKRYIAPLGAAYSLGSKAQNEHGLLLGASGKGGAHWTWNTYADYAFHPFAKYRADQSSSDAAYLLQATRQHRHANQWVLRYKLRYSEHNNADHSALSSTWRHTFHAQYYYPLGVLRTSTALDAVCYHTKETPTEWGRMISQKAQYTLPKWKFAALVGWFHTPSYQSALRLYEPQMEYAFALNTCFHHGIHTSLCTTWKTTRQFTLQAKYNLTHYTNQSAISSGTQRIPHPTQQDIYLQVLWKF